MRAPNVVVIRWGVVSQFFVIVSVYLNKQRRRGEAKREVPGLVNPVWPWCDAGLVGHGEVAMLYPSNCTADVATLWGTERQGRQALWTWLQSGTRHLWPRQLWCDPRLLSPSARISWTTRGCCGAEQGLEATCFLQPKAAFKQADKLANKHLWSGAALPLWCHFRYLKVDSVAASIDI